MFGDDFDSFLGDLAGDDFAFDEDHVFLVECADLLDDVKADFGFGGGHLNDSAHVAEEDEGYSSKDSDVVDPAG